MNSRIKPDCAVAQDLKLLKKEVEQMKGETPEPEKAKVGQAKGRPEWSRRGIR